mmetsp:Transcript_88120/g.139260  ORF Transcript_88120/g.139260 Transcript_88120/m.139260 type:complete len:213 (+) Transcript_88120:843-1481(+)
MLGAASWLPNALALLPFGVNTITPPLVKAKIKWSALRRELNALHCSRAASVINGTASGPSGNGSLMSKILSSPYFCPTRKDPPLWRSPSIRDTSTPPYCKSSLDSESVKSANTIWFLSMVELPNFTASRSALFRIPTMLSFTVDFQVTLNKACKACMKKKISGRTKKSSPIIRVMQLPMSIVSNVEIIVRKRVPNTTCTRSQHASTSVGITC